MARIVAIHQPNYIPWAGYFHKILAADLFVILDNVQFPKGHVGNRNKIKAKNGEEKLLSVSVKLSKGAVQNYNEIEIDYSSKWNIKQINVIRDSYLKAPCFEEYFPEFREILKTEYRTLADLNITLIKWVAEKLDIGTRLEIASDIKKDLGTKNERNMNICKYFDADKYLSGGGARKYNDKELFAENNIQIIYSDYVPLVYEQLNGDFINNLSILDMLFNCKKEKVIQLIS